MHIEGPWDEPKDLLDRKQYADFLTKYLSTRHGSFVLNLNAGWGMGKTFFISHWRASINRTHPTVYVNAWESDFSEDPLLAVMSAVYEQLNDILPDEHKTIHGFSKAFKTGGRFLKGMAPILAKGIVHKALGADAGNELAKLANEDLADAAEKSMELLLQDHTDKVKSIAAFNKALESLVKDVTLRERSLPLFLFVDELDRCRPTYAIELLETIKHLFSIDGIVFVIATDSHQLQHSIRAIYGNDFDGTEYLRRFFDQEYKLPLPDYFIYSTSISRNFEHSGKLHFSCFELWHINERPSTKPDGWSNNHDLGNILAFFGKHYELSLRSINQVVVRLEAILSTSDKKWHAPWLIFLLCYQSKFATDLSSIRHSISKKTIGDNLHNKLIDGGDRIRWFYHNPFGNHIMDKEYSAADIAKDYITAIVQASLLKDSELAKKLTEPSDFRSYIKSELIQFRLGQRPDHEDLSKYIDYVDMAGYLS